MTREEATDRVSQASGVSRRSFVKGMAVTLASAAAAGTLATAAGCSPKTNTPANGEGTSKTQAVCRFCGCGCA